jgi:hypothetical protein
MKRLNNDNQKQANKEKEINKTSHETKGKQYDYSMAE